MGHDETTQAEFTRQAETFRDSPTLGAEEVTARVGEALGPRRDRVIDVACGPGLLLPTLAEHARSVVGVDLTRESLRLADEGAPAAAHLVRARAEQLPFRPGSFDGAVVRLALHHFAEPARALAAIRALLGDGGRLVVLDVLGPDDREVARLRDALERLRDPSHTALLSRDAMAAALGRAGFALRDATLWSRPRAFSEWARIVNEPRRTADLETVLRALCRAGGDAAGLRLRQEDGALWFTYDWGLFVADVDRGGSG